MCLCVCVCFSYGYLLEIYVFSRNGKKDVMDTSTDNNVLGSLLNSSNVSSHCTWHECAHFVFSNY